MVHITLDALGMQVQRLAGHGKRGATRMAREQRHADGRFEIADALARRAERQVAQRRRLMIDQRPSLFSITVGLTIQRCRRLGLQPPIRRIRNWEIDSAADAPHRQPRRDKSSFHRR
jgi:hypothetical protein